MKFIEHQGMQFAIRGHVLLVKDKVLDRLQRFAYAEVDLPWAFAEEGDEFQLAHPLNMEERKDFAWLYHRMAALDKESTLDKQEPLVQDDGSDGDDPGPLVA